ncbi:hypothetical protein BDF22DRAFT_663167 [Syncephalis plumigaleata]|nr:hypothetical protein BDF22DRAFT_663167 [Syncephalis plumigaleata]
MKCIPGDKEKRAFEALLTALKELTGSYAAYRSNVAYPLTYVKVDADSTRPSGYCFVYRYINGVTLREYMAEEDYATRLIIINQIMPQLLQAFIYLYNAGVNHRDVHTMSIMIEKQDSKGLKVVLIDFDVVGILPDDRRMLDINLTPTNDVTGLRSPYTCDYFHQMPGYFIRELIPQYAVADPLRLTSHEYDKIRKHIRQATSSKITSLKYLIKHKFTTATNAYISLMRVNTISRHSNDCSSFVTTLKSVYPSSLYPTRGITTNNLHNRL